MGKTESSDEAFHIIMIDLHIQVRSFDRSIIFKLRLLDNLNINFNYFLHHLRHLFEFRLVLYNTKVVEFFAINTCSGKARFYPTS